jgi:Na+/glutamate symporter
MHEMGARVHSANSALDEAVIMLGEVGHALAVAHAAEVEVERTGAFLLRVGVVLLGLVVAGVTGVLLLRWLLQHPEPEPAPVIGQEDVSTVVATVDPDDQQIEAEVER